MKPTLWKAKLDGHLTLGFDALHVDPVICASTAKGLPVSAVKSRRTASLPTKVARMWARTVLGGAVARSPFNEAYAPLAYPALARHSAVPDFLAPVPVVGFALQHPSPPHMAKPHSVDVK